MTSEIVKGLPSTHGDHYQLNTTTLIRHAARTYPEQEIVYRSPDGGWDRYTYADAYTRIMKAANMLRGLGAGPGDVVGILDWNSKRHFELYWAIPGIAAVMLQMNLRLAPEDLGYVTDHSDAAWVLVDETLLPVAERLAPHAPKVRGWIVMSDKPSEAISSTLPNVHHFEELLAAADADIDWPVIDETSAYSACYTTGTTGRPKGIYYSHRGIYLHTMAMVVALGMRSADTVMLIAPMFHAQCWGLPQAAVQVAAKIVLPGRYMAEDTKVLVDAMIAEQVTVANGAPAIFQPMMDHIKSLAAKPDFSRARLLSGATEPPLSLMRDFYARACSCPVWTAGWSTKPATMSRATVSAGASCCCAGRGSSSATTSSSRTPAGSSAATGAAATSAASTSTATSSSPTGSRTSSKAAASGSPPSTWRTPSPRTHGSRRPRSSASSTRSGRNAPSCWPSPTTARRSRSRRSTSCCAGRSPNGSCRTPSSTSTRCPAPASASSTRRPCVPPTPASTSTRRELGRAEVQPRRRGGPAQTRPPRGENALNEDLLTALRVASKIRNDDAVPAVADTQWGGSI